MVVVITDINEYMKMGVLKSRSLDPVYCCTARGVIIDAYAAFGKQSTRRLPSVARPTTGSRPRHHRRETYTYIFYRLHSFHRKLDQRGVLVLAATRSRGISTVFYLN